MSAHTKPRRVGCVGSNDGIQNLLQPSSILFTSQENVHILMRIFLLQDDEHF